MQLGWIRHGRTDWNAAGKIQGQTDIPLNEEGKAQARRLAARLLQEGAQWTAVVSSDLQRAQQTAAILADGLGIRLLAPDVRLRERNYGLIEGTTEEERLGRWGSDWKQMELGQESNEAIKARGLAFVQELLTSSHRGDKMLVVTHGGFLTQLLHALCSGLDNSYISNLSYSIMSVQEDGSWKSLLHNCTAHLASPQP